MLNHGEKMMSYEFSGYWKDVGTISSLYDANMDMLGDAPDLNLDDRTWVIRSRNPIVPPHYVGNNARIVNSAVAGGCDIEGVVEHSVLSHSVVVEEGATVKNSIIFSETVIKSGAVVENAIIDENVTVEKNARVGKENDEHKIAVLGREVVVGEGATVEAGEIVDKNVRG